MSFSLEPKQEKVYETHKQKNVLILDDKNKQQTLSVSGFKLPDKTEGHASSERNKEGDSLEFSKRALNGYVRKLINSATVGGSLQPRTILSIPGREITVIDESKEGVDSTVYGVELILDCSIVNGSELEFSKTELIAEPDIVNHRYLKYSLTYRIPGIEISSTATNFALYDEDMDAPSFNSYRGHFVDSPIIDRAGQLQDLNGSSTRYGFGSSRIVNIVANNLYRVRGSYRWYDLGLDVEDTKFGYYNDTCSILSYDFERNQSITHEVASNNKTIYSGPHKGKVLHLVGGSHFYWKYRDSATTTVTVQEDGSIDISMGDWEGFSLHAGDAPEVGRDLTLNTFEVAFFTGKTGGVQNLQKGLDAFCGLEDLSDYYTYLMFVEATTRSSQSLLKVEDYLMKKFTS